MKRYKLIKTYPGSPKLGFVIPFDKDANQYRKDEYNFTISDIENYPEHWQKLKLLFYTEDFKDGSFPKKSCNNCQYFKKGCKNPKTHGGCACIIRHGKKNQWQGKLKGGDIYEGDDCWIVWLLDKPYIKKIETDEYTTKCNDGKYFSNEKNAKTYYNKLKWEGKLKFKVGNKIKSKNYTLIKKIKNIDWLNEQYIVPLETSITDGAIKFIKQNNWQLYKEPKFITVEGFKKYIGDELGYFVDNGLGFNYSAEKINKYTEIIDSYKYFNTKIAARQYIAKQTAAKRSIEVGTELFTRENIYVGKVDVIGQEDYPFSVKCNGRILRSSFILTLKELALKEGIEVGMKIDTDLVESWYKKKYPKFQKNQKLEREVYKISALGIESKIPIFKVTHPIAEIRDINIIGFKDFKEKWEAESSAERKANKLGFKIGDKVWGNKPLRHGNFKHKYYGEIDSFFINARGKLAAIFTNRNGTRLFKVTNKVAIHTPTKEDFEFICFKLGTEPFEAVYKPEDVCLIINPPMNAVKGYIGYEDINLLRHQGYLILSVDEYMKSIQHGACKLLKTFSTKQLAQEYLNSLKHNEARNKYLNNLDAHLYVK